MSLTFTLALTDVGLPPEEMALPKYTRDIINLCNGYAQATRPKHIGQMTSVMAAYRGSGGGRGGSAGAAEARAFVRGSLPPGALEEAQRKVREKLVEVARAVQLLLDTPRYVDDWVEDLVVDKTVAGLLAQTAVLRLVAEQAAAQGAALPAVREATPEEEARGIDGFVGGVPLQVKPASYATTAASKKERIPVPIVYYERKKGGKKTPPHLAVRVPQEVLRAIAAAAAAGGAPDGAAQAPETSATQ